MSLSLAETVPEISTPAPKPPKMVIIKYNEDKGDTPMATTKSPSHNIQILPRI